MEKQKKISGPIQNKMLTYSKKYYCFYNIGKNILSRHNLMSPPKLDAEFLSSRKPKNLLEAYATRTEIYFIRLPYGMELV